MVDKYYKPEIEEFHVGFEYYIKNFIKPTDKVDDEYLNNEENFNWVCQIWKSHMVMEENFNVIEYRSGRATIITVPDSIKAKYLNKEDIESLGWEGQKANSVYFKRDGYRLVHWMVEPQREITIFKIHNDSNEEVVFRGIVKNKSELTKIMKQVL